MKKIEIECWTSENWEKANACKAYKYSTTEYNYSLRVPARYNYAVIGGLLTFWHGNFSRSGIKCSWIEQGRGVSEFTIKSGYVVKGEHIEAKTLQEAQRINAEHRSALLAKLLKQRIHIKETEKKMESTFCTIQDSINAGNCMPGTMNFCNKLFAQLGKEVESISLAQLRRYGRMFGVEAYSERVIRYMLAR